MMVAAPGKEDGWWGCHGLAMHVSQVTQLHCRQGVMYAQAEPGLVAGWWWWWWWGAGWWRYARTDHFDHPCLKLNGKFVQ